MAENSNLALPSLPVVRLKQFDIRNRVDPYLYIWPEDIFVVVGKVHTKAILMKLDKERKILKDFYDLDRFELVPEELYLHLLD